MELTDAQSFARVLAAFAGERYPLDAGGSKVMRFMFYDRSGCDAAITARSFQINFGWNYGPHRYYLYTAPPIVSWLLDVAGARGELEVRAAVGPTEIPVVQQFCAWQMSGLHVAMVAGRDQVSIRVRDCAAELADPLPVPLSYVSRLVESTHACRHCGEVPDRYRVLSDDSFVCLACGRSQPPFK